MSQIEQFAAQAHKPHMSLEDLQKVSGWQAQIPLISLPNLVLGRSLSYSTDHQIDRFLTLHWIA
jgi:hypothetical protein